MRPSIARSPLATATRPSPPKISPPFSEGKRARAQRFEPNRAPILILSQPYSLSLPERAESLCKDEKIWQVAEEVIEKHHSMPRKEELGSFVKNWIKNNAPDSSFLGKSATKLIDVIAREEDPAVLKEYLYVMLQMEKQFLAKTARETGALSGEGLNGRLKFIANSQFNKIFEPGLALHKLLLGDNSPIDNLSWDDAVRESRVLQRFNALIELYSALDLKNFNFTAERAKQLITDLGPSLVKLAQTISSQSDSLFQAGGDIGQKIVSACRDLQTQNHPMTPEEVKGQLKKAFGPNWQERFLHLNTKKPLATGTIAGVYEGVLKDGQKVAVKVLKPHIKEQLREDRADFEKILELIDGLQLEWRAAAGRLGHAVPGFMTNIEMLTKIRATIDSFLETFENELNFAQEAEKQRHSSCLTPTVLDASEEVIVMGLVEHNVKLKHYADHAAKTINIPPVQGFKKDDLRPFEEKVVEQVKTFRAHHYPFDAKSTQIELKDDGAHVHIAFYDVDPLHLKVGLDGKVKALAPFIDYSQKARKHLAKQVIVDSFQQFADGILNGDPHAGNIDIVPSPKGNRLMHYDFGNTLSLKKQHAQTAIELLTSLFNPNLDKLVLSSLKMTGQYEEPGFDQETLAAKLKQKYQEIDIKGLYNKDPELFGRALITSLADLKLSLQPHFFQLIRTSISILANHQTLAGEPGLNFLDQAHLATQVAKTVVGRLIMPKPSVFKDV